MNAHTREPFHIRILKGLLGIIWSIDWPLMVIVLILSAWGFVALYSASSELSLSLFCSIK